MTGSIYRLSLELKVNPNDISAEQLESDLHRADELFDQGLVIIFSHK